MENDERGRPPKKFEDAELEALLEEDDGQTQVQLAEQLGVTQSTVSERLKALGFTLKVGRWVPHELTERQQENRKTTCEMLLKRFKRKSFLHRIVTGDEKWVYFKNPKRKKSYVRRGKAQSTPRPDRFGRKAMLCVFWDQRGIIWYDLLQSGETVNGERYQQQLTDLHDAIAEKRPEYEARQHKVIFLDDNAPPHRTRAAKNLVESFNWEPLEHAAYSPDLAPSDFHLFASMGHALNEKRFNSHAEAKKWIDDWFKAKDAPFFWRGIHKLPERWQKCVASDGHYFEE